MIRIARAAFALLAGAGALLLMAGPASAGTTTLTSDGGYARYDDATHILKVCDTNADGHNEYAWYNYGTSQVTPTNRVETSGGSGTCNQVTLSSGSSQITFRACTNKSGGPDDCSGWATVSY